MRKRRKWLATLMTFIMLVTMLPAGAFAQNEAETPGLEIGHSKSKTATGLTMDENGDYYSDVTLSLPSAEEKLESDVVLVLDKSTSATLEDKALDMLSNLQQTVKETDAKVNVGVVIFNKEAHTDGVLHDLATEYDTIKEAITEDISSGTNTHAGLLAGKRMLDEDTDVLDSRKYLVFVSDGITYMYNEEPTAIGLQNGDKTNIFAGPDNWNTKYGNNEAPADWDKWLSDIEAQIDTDGTTYDTPYDTDYSNSYIAWDERDDHAMSIDKALYLTDQVYNEAKAEGYHCYAMKASTNADHPWASSFMEYLSGGETVSFDGIGDDINYLLNTGTVTDYMGYDKYEDGTYYNFDFVNDPSKLKLTVGGGEPLQVTEIEENKYGFGEKNEDGSYDYVLTYNADDKTVDEHFVWEINVPVTNFEKVQLTYTVQLMNPRTDAGTYGTYDEDGSEQESGLYTNNKAILKMQDTIGSEPTTEMFNKPTVSYTVDALTITPADITIYTGGESYEGVVGDLEDELDTPEAGSSEGLPEPGYYITLPDWLNDKVKIGEEGADAETGAADLSTFDLTFTYDGKDSEGNTVEREWPLDVLYR